LLMRKQRGNTSKRMPRCCEECQACLLKKNGEYSGVEMDMLLI
jgi:hypothetical protein